MFILHSDEFTNNNPENIIDFIHHWSRFYINNAPYARNGQGKNMDETIDYLTELNIGNDLTEQNITRLLRWKMWRTYTHPQKDGKDNQKVKSILKKIEELNNFRQVEELNNLIENKFRKTA
ncbi:MAG: hypothetical protein ACYSWZ_23995 [Planctomycetota bacterium]|jgi:hypothetical protein